MDEKVIDKGLVAYCGLYCGDCFVLPADDS